MEPKPKASEVPGIDLIAVLALLREKLWLILLCGALGAVVAAIYAARSPRIYQATTTIEVEAEQRKLNPEPGAAARSLGGEEVLRTIEQSLTSPEVLVRVVRRNLLEKDLDFLPDTKRPLSDEQIQRALGGQISTGLRRGTRLIDVQVEDRSPAMAQRIAQMLVREFALYNFEARRQSAETAGEFLLQDVQRLKAKLAASEQALQEYREKQNAVSLEERQNIVVEKLRELSARVTSAKGDRLRLEADVAQVRGLESGPPEQLLGVTSVAQAPAVSELKRSLTAKESEMAVLSQRYKAEHPKYIAAQSEIENLRASLGQAIRKAAAAVASNVEAAAANERALEEALQQQEKAAIELNRISIPYQVLAREVESDRTLLDSVLRKLKEIDATKGVAEHSVRVVSRAFLPERPVRPKKTRLLALGLLAGLALGSSFVLGLGVFDRSLRSLAHAERQLGLPVLGVIPLCADSKSGGPLRLREPDSPTAESFRGLRVRLSQAGEGGRWQVLLVTSAAPGEGKSSCAVNGALAFAQLGLKTLLIDADLHRPKAAKALGVEAPIGLAELLGSGAALTDTIHASGVENLSVITAGTDRKRAGELLAGGAVEPLLRELRLLFDRIVIDTAPVNAVTDPLLLAPHADGVCLVVRAASAPADTVLRAKQKLAEAGAAVIGFIFNCVKPASMSGYYQYGDYYQDEAATVPGWKKRLRKLYGSVR